MQNEGRRKRVPGVHSHVAVINELRQELVKVNNSINELKDKISAIYKQEKENSPKNDLYRKLEELSTELKELKEGRSIAFNSKDEVSGSYDRIKNELNPEKGKGRRPINASEIDARMREVNLKLISDKQDPKAEKAFEAEIENLRRQKREIGTVEQKNKMAIEMKAKLDALNEEIKRSNKKISEKQSLLDEIRGEIKEINDQSKKNPVVEGYEKNIQGLKSKKHELSERIKVQQEEIRKKELEHDKFLEEMSLAQALEKQKDDLRQKIGKLEEQKNTLSSEQAKFDPSKFDSVIFGVKRLGLSGGKVSVPIDLALHLNQCKISIPVSAEQIGPTIELLKSRKKSFSEEVVEKQKEFESKIFDLDRRISEEKRTLSNMPPTDIRILKFNRRD